MKTLKRVIIKAIFVAMLNAKAPLVTINYCPEPPPNLPALMYVQHEKRAINRTDPI